VHSITDSQPAERDNDDRIAAARSVPVPQDGHKIRQNPVSGRSLDNQRRKIRAKSLVLEYFTRKSFKLKDLAENFA
jgi:hypothetical protein